MYISQIRHAVAVFSLSFSAVACLAQSTVECADFGVCAGQFRICRFNVQENGPIQVQCNGAALGLSIIISNVDSPIVPGAPGFIEIYPMASNVNLASLEINFAPTAGAASDVLVTVFENNGSTRTLGSIGSIRKGTASSPGTLRLASLTAPVITGPIEAANLGSVISAGALSGSITSVPEAGAASTALGEIKTIRSIGFPGSTTSNITSNITAKGRIREVRADNGTIGLPGAPITIQNANQIDIVEARAVHANINNQWNYPQFGIDSGVIFLKTTNGSLTGGLTMRQIETSQPLGGLDIAGPLDANIILGTASSNSPGKIEEPVFIRGGFAAGRTIQCKGITSQIIFNRENNPANTIAGTIQINGWNVSPLPYYQQTRSSIGGGAIGLVPFMVHYAESTPSAPFNQPGVPTCAFHATDSPRTSITLEHYGRVGFRNGTQWVSQPPANTIGVTVHKRHKDSPCTETSWVDVTASGSFTAEMNPNSSRGIVVCGPFTDTNFYYRIRPVTTTGPGLAPLYCREVNDANPPAVGAYENIFLPVIENIQGGCFEGEC